VRRATAQLIFSKFFLKIREIAKKKLYFAKNANFIKVWG